MKKVTFNLNYYLKHHPMIVTRDGRNVRIVCTDCKEPGKPVVALIDYSIRSEGYYNEICLTYTSDGFYLSHSEEESEDDLLMLI